MKDCSSYCFRVPATDCKGNPHSSTKRQKPFKQNPREMHVGLDTNLSGKSYTLFNRKQGCWKCNSQARGLAEALGFDSSIQNLSMKRRKAEIDSTWLRGGRRSPVLERVLALLSLLHKEPSSRANSRQAPKLHSPLKAGSHSCFHTGTKTLRFQPGGQPRWLAGGLKSSPWLA